MIVLLGGIDEEGNHLEGSVAKFYKDFFGLSRSVIEPTGRVYSTPFQEFVTDIISKTEAVMKSIKAEKIYFEDVKLSETNYDELLKNPEEVVRLIEDFYNKCTNVTPNYNEYTLFVLNIRTITKSYFNMAFPWLLEKFDKVRELLTLTEKITFNIQNTKQEYYREYYTIWSYSSYSLGYNIRELYEYIWNQKKELKDTLSQYFEGITDLKHEFIESAKESITSIPYEFMKSYGELPYRCYYWIKVEEKDGKIYDDVFLKKDCNVFGFLDEVILNTRIN